MYVVEKTGMLLRELGMQKAGWTPGGSLCDMGCDMGSGRLVCFHFSASVHVPYVQAPKTLAIALIIQP